MRHEEEAHGTERRPKSSDRRKRVRGSVEEGQRDDETKRPFLLIVPFRHCAFTTLGL